jgi:monofunctional biosynthetic peptidoglycan transglycosylase
MIPCLLALWGTLCMHADPVRPLFDFKQAAAATRWQAVNDGVMGGVSQGAFRLTPAGILEFTGTLSLENNGGFASVRSKPANLGLKSNDTLLIKLKGDGRDYSLNLYINRPLMAFSYRANFATKKDEWLEIRAPLANFVATSFGREVASAGPVDPAEIIGVGFMLSDKKPGPFRLEIESIQAVSPGR